MTITLIILAATIVMFVTGRIRSDIVALCALTLLILSGILTPTEALAGFSSPVVIMMVGLFVVGGAILQTGLAKAASQRIMKLAAGSDTKLFLLVIVVTAVIGAFVSNTGTVALMMHAGEYTFGDYVKVGLPLQIIMGIVMTFALPLLFPF